MTRSTIATLLGLFLSPVFSLAAQAQSAVTEQEAQAIAADAYIYFYPLVTMDLTRKQLTNIAPGNGVFGGPMNMLLVPRSSPPPSSGLGRNTTGCSMPSCVMTCPDSPCGAAVPRNRSRPPPR